MTPIQLLSASEQAVQQREHSLLWGPAVTAFLFVAYLLSFPFLYPVLGDAVSAFTCLPVISAAWHLGRRPAYVFSIALTLTSFLLFRLFNNSILLPVQILMALVGLWMLLFISAITGWASEMRQQLQQERKERKRMERALQESEERYRTLYNDAGDSILIYDMEGQVLEMNQTAAQHLGYSAEELLEMNVADINDMENAIQYPQQIEQIRNEGQTIFDTYYIRKDGEFIPMEVNCRVISVQGKPAVLSVARDISKRKAIEQSEHEQRAFAEALRDVAANLTGTLNIEEVLDRILDQVDKVVKHDSAAIMLVEGENVCLKRYRGNQTFHLNDLTEVNFRINDFATLCTMASTRKPLVIANTKEDPRWRYHPATQWIESFAGAPIHIKGTTIGYLNLDSHLPNFFTQAQAERLQAFADQVAIAVHNARLYEEVQRMALVDELTQVYNRRGLLEFGSREIERAHRFNRPLAVLMIDIDNFKQFNDQYSYAVGDLVLATFAQRCKARVRKVDLVARYGGDEFVILLAENSLESACVVAEYLRKAVEEQPFETEDGSFFVTASFGASALKDEDWDLTALISAAGEALHQAKHEGRNQVALSKP